MKVVSKVDLLAGPRVDWSVDMMVGLMVVAKVVNLESSKVYLKAD